MTRTRLFCAIIAFGFLWGNTAAPHKNVEKQKTRLCSASRLFLNETGKCHRPGSQGPCIETMTVQLKDPWKDDIEGTCACHYYNTCYPQRPYIFFRKYNRCYFLFDEGPCPQGEWMNVNDKREPICETIPCLQKYSEQKRPLDNPGKFPSIHFLFSKNNKCYMTFEQADFCRGKKFGIIDNNTLKPNCSTIMVCSSALPESNRCDDGTAEDRFGGCEPVLEF